MQALGRAGRRARQHRLELRCHLVDQRHPHRRRFDPRVGVVGRWVGRRRGCAALPGEQRAGPGILAEEEAQRGRAGAGQPQPEQRGQDLLVVDLRMAPVPVLHLQPDGEQPDRLVAEHRHPELVERPGGDGPVEQGDQPLVEALLAEVGEPAARPRLGDHLVGRRCPAQRVTSPIGHGSGLGLSARGTTAPRARPPRGPPSRDVATPGS